eukprot:EG_transcript_9902
MAIWPLSRVEGVVVTMKHEATFSLTKEAKGSSVSDLLVETLDGRIPGLFAKVKSAGLGGEPPSGVQLSALIFFRGLEDPIAYFGCWVDGPGGRTAHHLPVCTLSAQEDTCQPPLQCLRLVFDVRRDTLLLSDARQADFSGVAAGVLSEQLLLRAHILTLSDLCDLAGLTEPCVVVLTLGRINCCTYPFHVAHCISQINEEFTFLLSPETAQDLPNLTVQLLDSQNRCIAHGDAELKHVEPVKECVVEVALQPAGVATLEVELTALLDSEQHPPAHRRETSQDSGLKPVEFSHVRHSGYLMKMQKKKFGLYHKRWFDLYDTALQYYKSSGDDRLVKRLDITHATLTMGPPHAHALVVVIDSGRHKLTVKAAEDDIRKWVQMIQLAQGQAEVKRKQLERKVKSILKGGARPVREGGPAVSKSVTIVDPPDALKK